MTHRITSPSNIRPILDGSGSGRLERDLLRAKSRLEREGCKLTY
jgi:hypothetical protein